MIRGKRILRVRVVLYLQNRSTGCIFMTFSFKWERVLKILLFGIFGRVWDFGMGSGRCPFWNSVMGDRLRLHSVFFFTEYIQIAICFEVRIRLCWKMMYLVYSVMWMIFWPGSNPTWWLVEETGVYYYRGTTLSVLGYVPNIFRLSSIGSSVNTSCWNSRTGFTRSCMLFLGWITGSIL